MDSLEEAYSYRKVTIYPTEMFLEDKISDDANDGMGTLDVGAEFFSNDILDQIYTQFKKDPFRKKEMQPIF